MLSLYKCPFACLTKSHTLKYINKKQELTVSDMYKRHGFARRISEIACELHTNENCPSPVTATEVSGFH